MWHEIEAIEMLTIGHSNEFIMAELNVQPKKKSSILPWVLLLLAIIAVAWFLTRDKDVDSAANTVVTDTTAVDSISSTPVLNRPDTAEINSRSTANNDWNSVDFNAPVVKYEEITDQNINVQGNTSYGIYSIGESVLFDEGKAELRSNAKANLNQIKSSLLKRYEGSDIRVYGYTDTEGSSETNKDLAARRANAVKDWLQTNGIDASRISVNAVGEARPAASNATEQGRQQNRRVEIVARGNGTT